MTKEDIFAIDDVKKEKVEIPEWNISLWIKTMTGHELNELQAIVNPEGKIQREKMMLNLLVRTICNEKGDLLFTPLDIDNLGRKNASVLKALFDVACRLNGLGKDEVDTITKN